MGKENKEFVRNAGTSAFCYYRYSSDAQRDVSIEQQKQAAKEFAKRRGYTICKEFEDRAITGTRYDRPGLQHMLYEAKKYRPAYLLVWKLDRLSRDIHDSFFIDAQLRDCGVEIVTIGETLPEDEGMRIAVQALYASMSHNFILTHRSNVLRGLNYNAEHALYNGRKILGYIGKPEHRYEIDKNTAPIVQRIFREYADGKPLQHICADLNSAGLRTVLGNEFKVNSLRSILVNRSYIGEYAWGEHIVKDGFPRLVSDELFEAVQSRLAANRHGGKRAIKRLNPEIDNIADYWLGGHIYCGECGETLQGVSGTSKSGKIYYYYSCKAHRKHQCSLKNQKKDLLESIVKNALNSLLNDGALRVFIAEKCYQYYRSQNCDDVSLEESIKSSLKDINNRLKNIMKAIEAGIFNDTVQEKMLSLEEQKAFHEEELKAIRNRKKYELKLEDIIRFLHSFVGNFEDAEVRKKVLDIFVDKIYIYNTKIVISFHFDEDMREITLEDAEKFLKNQKRIAEMMDENTISDDTLYELLESICGKEGDNSSDFFQ
ncbi:MAG: recombinase family protein [Lachnospiraceae bacterium]|nr:recombinase family protein [Lachnospiraceae bacterium]